MQNNDETPLQCDWFDFTKTGTNTLKLDKNCLVGSCFKVYVRFYTTMAQFRVLCLDSISLAACISTVWRKGLKTLLRRLVCSEQCFHLEKLKQS